ncbi:MAG: energy transducer TonB [bacterium]
MSGLYNRRRVRFIDVLGIWHDEHPYSMSFLCAVVLLSYMLFRTPVFNLSNKEFSQTDRISIVHIDKIKAPKRMVKKQISTKDTASVETEPSVDRAVGTSDDPDAVDLSFYPNIAPPRPIGKLKKLYPARAKKMNIEALIHVELLIDVDGKVKKVDILGIRISKALAPELHAQIAQAFSRDAVTILLGAAFTPPLVNGKRVPIKMELPLKFRLE